jgi:hypothetical protein
MPEAVVPTHSPTFQVTLIRTEVHKTKPKQMCTERLIISGRAMQLHISDGVGD